MKHREFGDDLKKQKKRGGRKRDLLAERTKNAGGRLRVPGVPRGDAKGGKKVPR